MISYQNRSLSLSPYSPCFLSLTKPLPFFSSIFSVPIRTANHAHLLPKPKTQDGSSISSHPFLPSVVSISFYGSVISGSDEGPPRRRLPLLHRLHVTVRRLRRRPAGEEAAADRPSLHHHHHHHHHHGTERRGRRRRRGEGESRQGGGGTGDRRCRGATADQGDQEPVSDVRGVRRGGEGDRDRVPHRRAARRAHRVGRAEQGRRHGHGERLLPALLPLHPAARDGHGRSTCLS